MKRVLVTGACGQIGSELVIRLGKLLGNGNVLATDIKRAPDILKKHGNFTYLNVLDSHMFAKEVVDFEADAIFHMAAILSASGEKDPQLAYQVNMTGLMNALEVSRRKGVQMLITPSSIAVYGPDAPKLQTVEDAPLNPTTMYGVTKVAGEKLLQYYHIKYGLDTRSLRYPGIISAETPPGGGTTDFAVDLYWHALRGKPYSCFVKEDAALPFMYMPDAIKAIIDLAKAPAERLHRRVYNVHAMSLTAGDIVASIRNHIPDFRVEYRPDYRQEIADSWPASLNDAPAREDWRWRPDFGLEAMTRDMLDRIKRKLSD